MVLSLVLCAAAGLFVQRSIHWQVMWDPSAMHYVSFLMAHGLAPYRDIIDINLPGSYLAESWAMHVFGGGDLGWRLYDFSLLAVLTGSLISIARPYDWFAGLYAGVIFLLIHGSEGPRNAGQREEVMIVLIMAGYALLFGALRRRRPVLLLPCGFSLGFAATFKPTVAPLGLVLLGMMAFSLRKRKIALTPYLGYGVLGLSLAVLTTLNFFYKYHAFSDFVAISKRLIPYYAGTGNRPVSFLLPLLVTRPLLASLVIGAALVLFNRATLEWERWERSALALGIAFGAFSYLAQGKDFNHHAYTFEVFVLFWSGLEFAKAMHRRGWMQVVGAACLIAGVLVLVPAYAKRVAAVDPLTAQPDALKADLIRLGGSRLDHQVECLDLVDGCLGALYRLNLIQNTKIMGDYMVLGPRGSHPPAFYREMLWNDLHRDPPKVIVLTKMWLAEENSFDKLDQWPELARYLDTAYTVDVERTFGQRGYRIYLLKPGA